MNNLTGIDDESREELENKKQEVAHQYEIVMQAHGKFHTNLQKEEIQLQKFFGVQRKKDL